MLILAGVLLRPLSLVLLAAFIFFAALLPESYTSHILFYGVMLSFPLRKRGGTLARAGGARQGGRDSRHRRRLFGD